MTDFELYEYSENKLKEARKRIAELEKDNAELKAKNKWYSEQVCNKECAEVWGNLTKAKELLGYIVKYYREDEDLGLAKEINEAEQFLKESK